VAIIYPSYLNNL